MPTNGLEFNATDESSWYFGQLSRSETNDLLQDQECGTFLVRDSTTLKGDFVLCVREGTKTMHYIINKIEEGGGTARYKIGNYFFESMPMLLRHYTTHYLDTTQLLKPLTKPSANPRRDSISSSSQNIDTSLTEEISKIENSLISMSKNISQTLPSVPIKARVIKDRIPSLYDKRSLRLQVGDILTVTRTEINGQCEGHLENSKRHGTFPFTYVEFMPNDNEQSD